MGKAVNILIVEDVRADFLLIKRHLEKHLLHSRCRSVSSLGELLTAIDESGWDVVLSDYNLPGVNFAEVLATCQTRLPEVPFILVSGSVGDERAVELLKLGVWDFILKDNLVRLVSAIEHGLQKAAERRGRRAAEEALLESEEKFRKIFQSSPDPIMIAPLHEGCNMDVNDAFLDFTGFSLPEVMGKTFLDLGLWLTGEDRETFGSALKATGSLKAFETRFQTKQGIRSVLLSADTITLRQCPCMLIVIKDITELKRSQQERALVEAQLRQGQKLEALGTLAGGIAHDFNNILGIIMGYAELSRMETEEGSSLGNNLREVLNASERAKELVKQILTFSRRSEDRKLALQLGSTVKEAMKILRPSLPSTIEIKTEVLSESTVLADPTQIHQVLLNLCTNAAHSMRDRGGVLEVSLEDIVVDDEHAQPLKSIPPGHCVKLTVKDTGHGIDPAIIDSIFDPFFTTKGLGEGTGLGLSVVHGIVQGHGGIIDVESTVGKGTTFTVIIPALEAANEAVEKEIAAPLAGGKERILVVDDEPILARMLMQMLTRLGYNVVFRTNGLEALEVFESQPFDLVITDMTMPHLTGADLAIELSKLRPGVRVILMTGFSEKIDAEKAKKLGIQGFIMKPIILKDLADLIRKVVDKEN